MSILTINKSYLAKDISFRNQMMILFLTDGREIAIPIEWFPTLRDASHEDLNNWRFIGNGIGIHWETLDEDLLVENLVR